MDAAGLDSGGGYRTPATEGGTAWQSAQAISGRQLEWALNLRCMLPVAGMILHGALVREESRGAHHRSDLPEEEPEWRQSILYARGADGSLRLWTEPIPEIPEPIQAALEEEHELHYCHLE